MQSGQRLNLQALAPETDSVFVMLIVAVALLASFLGKMLIFLFGPGELSAETTQAPIGMTLVVSFVITTLVFGSTLYLYRRHPRQIRRAKNTLLITANDASIQQTVQGLAQQAGVSSPEVEISPKGSGKTGGQAFGLTPPYTIHLDDGLRSWQKYKRPLFDAVVLHELAHIKNGDIWRAYFSRALWTVFMYGLAAPFGIGLAIMAAMRALSLLQTLAEDPLTFLGTFAQLIGVAVQLGLQTIGVVLLPGLIWARLLRTREYAADWQASAWGAAEGIHQILQLMQQQEPPHTWFGWMRFHPSPGIRLNALENDDISFGISKTTAFLAGLLIAYSLTGGLDLALSAFLWVSAPLASMVEASTGIGELLIASVPLLLGIPAFFGLLFVSIAWLLSGSLGIQAQKQAMKDMAVERGRWRSYLRLGMPTLAFVIGLEFGVWAAPFNLFIPRDAWGWLVEWFLVLPVTFFAIWLYLAMMRFITRRVLLTQVGPKLSIQRKRFLNWLSHIWLALFFAPGLIFGRLALLEDENMLLLQGFLIWMVIAPIVAGAVLGTAWLLTKTLFQENKVRCFSCETVLANKPQALTRCPSCSTSLGGWLFIAQPYHPPAVRE